MDPNNVNPTMPTMPEAAPAMPASPEMPQAPVESVATANAPAGAAPVSPAMPEIPTPVSPVFQPGDVKVGEMDPITMPNPPKKPDPIEEELKAPMKAAGPVPGSIGSAISMPQSEQPVQPQSQPMGQVPNVAFNDPAAAQQNNAQPMAPAKKKTTDKKTLIILCAIAGVVMTILAGVLVMQMIGGV